MGGHDLTSCSLTFIICCNNPAFLLHQFFELIHCNITRQPRYVDISVLSVIQVKPFGNFVCTAGPPEIM